MDHTGLEQLCHVQNPDRKEHLAPSPEREPLREPLGNPLKICSKKVNLFLFLVIVHCSLNSR